MRRSLLMLAISAALVSACSSPAPVVQSVAATNAPPSAVATLAPPLENPSSAAATESAPDATQAPAPTATSAPIAIKTDFTPSDPSAVNLALGKPQLIEFYAVW